MLTRNGYATFSSAVILFLAGMVLGNDLLLVLATPPSSSSSPRPPWADPGWR